MSAPRTSVCASMVMLRLELAVLMMARLNAQEIVRTATTCLGACASRMSAHVTQETAQKAQIALIMAMSLVAQVVVNGDIGLRRLRGYAKRRSALAKMARLVQRTNVQITIPANV